jgi:hypothetical protein
MGGQRYAPAVLPPGKTWRSLYRRLGGLQRRYRWLWKFRPTTGIRSPDRPARSESLYRLSYTGPQDDVLTVCEYFCANKVVFLQSVDQL